MPILSGPLRAKRWIVRSGNYSCWLGRYELGKQRALVSLLRPGDVFFDVGAHVGFYTLLAAMCVGKAGKVIAFEPLPRKLRFLRRHVEINRLSNVQIMPAAVSDTSGLGRLKIGGNSYTNSLTGEGGGEDLEVETVALDDLTARLRVPEPDCIKLDIEGAEELALFGARRLLRETRPVVLLATHGDHLTKSCRAVLERLDYRIERLTGPGLAPEGEFAAYPL